jgi:hypothetical protein
LAAQRLNHWLGRVGTSPDRNKQVRCATLISIEVREAGSVTEPHDDRPALVVYVVWHPHAAISIHFAQQIFRELCADPDVPNRRGLGIPVRFRSSVSPDIAPTKIPFGTAKHTAVFVLADDKLVAEQVWRDYVAGLTEGAAPGDLVVGVAITDSSNLPPALGAEQAIRLHAFPPDHQETELLNNVKNDICRLFDPDATKVKVFLSHAKRDGVAITKNVRRHLHEETKLDDFFDDADIPDGTRFAEFITQNAGSLPVLLAIQTDSYGSREWCRLEVLEAKRRRVPIVVLTAIQIGETRSFPYIGNVPVVCWRDQSSLPAVVGALLGEVLRDRYFPERVRALCRQRGISIEHEVFTYPPELLTVLSYRVKTVAEGADVGRYLYPDPPLGAEELELLRQFDPDIDPVTPTVLWAT